MFITWETLVSFYLSFPKVCRYDLLASCESGVSCTRINGHNWRITLRHENANVIVSRRDITLRSSRALGNNFRPVGKLYGLAKVISYYTLMQRALSCSAMPPARLYKDIWVSKLVDYNKLLPQYVTYRIYRYLDGNGWEPLTVGQHVSYIWIHPYTT